MSPAPSLVVAGSVNVDLVATVERLPAPGETIGGGRLRRQAGGKGANQAAAASRLGAAVSFVGCIGDDADGRFVRAELAAAGVDTAGLRVVDEATGTALISVDADGENTIVVCPGANAHLGASLLDDPDTALLLQLETPVQTVEELVRRARGTVVLNAAPALHLSADLIDRVDLFVVNETEYAALPELAAARRVAVTLGADGAALYERDRLLHRAAGTATRVVDTVGAGDAFTAALTVGLLEGVDEATALATACRVGAVAVGVPSAQPAFEHIDRYRSRS
ncbi:ribokinase [Frigoribacterium sp. 2-23]|uniref:ribokinase n=1 Tax=Frigoribacterium sp. 2-23 TaxID=3415006 RepID=UPI003C704822